MNIDHFELFNASARVGELPEDTLVAQAYSVVDQAGYQFGLGSAGPEDRLREFFEEKVIPVIKEAQVNFQRWRDEAHQMMEVEIPEYLAKMQAEKYAGLNTARILATAATADALGKVIQLQGLTATDLAMLALFYLIYFQPPKSQR